MTEQTRPVVLSGIQPTGKLTIGNYIGAIRSWVSMQDRYDCMFVLVDLHALTVANDPPDLLRRCYEFIALYLGCGIDPDRSTVFVQSHVPQHGELAWILSCFAQFGRLSRMTQFREKARKHPDNVNAGLFAYPVLMAADILLYQSDLVPVGGDQKQHLELTRDLAQRFNSLYGQSFTTPEPYIAERGSRIMALQDPTSKMDKSDPNPANYIALLDDADTVRRKIMRAVTDEGKEIVYDEAKPGVANLLTIYSAIAGEPIDELEVRYAGKGYAPFKRDLGEALVEFLRPIQERYRTVAQDRDSLTTILRKGAEIARSRAEVTLEKVYRNLGLIPR
jgi:tryptophanyl-tRNA synthetase